MKKDTSCTRTDVDAKLLQNAKETLEKDSLLISHKLKIFSLIGNDVRLKIILLFLEYTKLCVCDLGDVLDMSQSSISQHLRKLKDGGLLENKREGMTIFYFIPKAHEEELKQLIKG